MIKYVLNTGWFFACSTRNFAKGLLICLTNKTPNLRAGNTPTTILLLFICTSKLENYTLYTDENLKMMCMNIVLYE